MHKHFSSPMELQTKRGARQFIKLSGAGLFLFVMAFVFLPYITAGMSASATDTGSAQVAVGVTEAWATLTTSSATTDDPTHGNVNLGTATPGANTLLVQSAKATAATNSPAGYSLYLSGGNDTESNNSSSLVTGAGATASKITSLPTSGFSNFSVSDPSKWGFAAKGADAISGFSDAYATGAYTETSGITANKYKGVPTEDSRALIAKRQSPCINPSSTCGETSVYYAALIGASTAAGTYSAPVTYTLVADFVTNNDPASDPNRPAGSTGDRPAYSKTDGGHVTYYYYGSQPGEYYYYNASGNKVTAQGVNKTADSASEIATIAGVSDGNITWAAVAVVAGASATFLAIALLRDREDEDEE